MSRSADSDDDNSDRPVQGDQQSSSQDLEPPTMNISTTVTASQLEADRDERLDESFSSALEEDVLDESIPPAVTTRPTTPPPRQAPWAALSRQTSGDSLQPHELQTQHSNSLADIMNEEEQRQQQTFAAQLEAEDLRVVELAQEEEMIRLAMERSMQDMQTSSHHSRNAASGFHTLERNKPYDRSLSSRRLLDAASRPPEPLEIPSQSWSSPKTPALYKQSSFLDNASNHSVPPKRQQQEVVQVEASTLSGREAVLEVARRNLSPAEVELIEQALATAEAQELAAAAASAAASAESARPGSSTVGTPDCDSRSSPGADMFDLDPDSPTVGDTHRLDRVDSERMLPDPPFDVSSSRQDVVSNTVESLEEASRKLSLDEKHPGSTCRIPRPTMQTMLLNDVGGRSASQRRLSFLEEGAPYMSSGELEGMELALRAAQAAKKAAAADAVLGAVTAPSDGSAKLSTKPAAAAKCSVTNDYDFVGAENHLTEEELRQIQQALQEASVAHETTEANSTGEADGKPASLSHASNTISSDDAEAIERAVREADEVEELKSLQLAMQMQEEENTRQHQDAAARQRQGNVRTMTRGEWDAETDGRAGAFRTSSPPIRRHPLEEAEEIPAAAGFRMNASKAQDWTRRDQNSVVGPNNEVRTKHDADLDGAANAERLGLESGDHSSVRVGNKAYNSFLQSVRRPKKAPGQTFKRYNSADSEEKSEDTSEGS